MRIKITTGDTNTILLFDGANPDYSGVPSYALKELEKAIDAGNYETIPDPPPFVDDSPQWDNFNKAFLANPEWQAGSIQLKETGAVGDQVLIAMISAASNGNADALQASFGLAIALMDSIGNPIPSETLAIWQGLANQYHIPVIF